MQHTYTHHCIMPIATGWTLLIYYNQRRVHQLLLFIQEISWNYAFILLFWPQGVIKELSCLYNYPTQRKNGWFWPLCIFSSRKHKPSGVLCGSHTYSPDVWRVVSPSPPMILALPLCPPRVCPLSLVEGWWAVEEVGYHGRERRKGDPYWSQSHCPRRSLDQFAAEEWKIGDFDTCRVGWKILNKVSNWMCVHTSPLVTCWYK